MPYTKQTRDGMLKLLGAYGLASGVKLAPVLGVSAQTAYRRIDHPEELTVGELRRLATHGHIPLEEVRNAV